MDGEEVKAYANKEQDKYPAILTNKQDLLQKNVTLIRIKNDFFFFLRAGKESRQCSQHNKPTRVI